MSIDDLYNNFKIIEQSVKKFVGASSGAQNLAFMTVPSTSSTNDVNTAKPLLYGSKYQDNTKKQGKNKDTSSKAMLAIDGVGFDWSDMAEEQLNQTEFIAATYKRGLETIEEQLVTYRKNEVLFSEEVAVLKREVACKDYEINVLKSKFEKVKQEKEGIKIKIEKFDNASKSLNKLLESQITDKSKKGLGYNDVLPPHPLIYNRPKKLDLSYAGLDEFKEPEFKRQGIQKTHGLLQPLPIPSHVWDDLSMDFITHLPASNGKTVIWVIVDRLSKFAHFLSLPTNFTADSLASIFLHEIYRLHGLPNSIVTDRDPLFLSRFWKELFAQLGTRLVYSSAYHPQNDGQTKVVNSQPNDTNLKSIYGRTVKAIHDYNPGSSTTASIDATLAEHSRITSLLKNSLELAQKKMATQANKHRIDKHFDVARIHSVFHVSLLRDCIGDHQPSVEVPLWHTDHLHISTPEVVLDRKTTQMNKVKVLIKWLGHDISEATWEDEEQIRFQFPEFPLNSRRGKDQAGHDSPRFSINLA
ncbi:ribonuclease H-like domain-containing protein [Tanacetum coccineum]